MIRTQLSELLNQFQTTFSEEEAMLQRMKDLVTDTTKDCFSRNNFEPGHFTASAWIVNESKNKVLLLHHAKLNKWLQPGGHIDSGESVLDAAIREVNEETAVSILSYSPTIFDVDIHLIPARKTEPDHFHFDVRFLFVADDTQPLLISEESNDLKWIPIKEVLAFNPDRSIERLVLKCSPLAPEQKI